MSATAWRVQDAIPSAAPRPVALPRHEMIAVAVVAKDARMAARVATELRREGVAAQVEHGGDGRLALDRLARVPDVVVFAGAAAATAAGEIHRVRRRLPHAHVVLVVPDDALRGGPHLLDAGVDGIVVESALSSTLALAVRSACAGQVSVPRGMRHGVDLPALSFRERQILGLVVAGLTNNEIAGRLYLAETTVKGHLTSAFRRLGVRSRREAVALIVGADESLRRSVLTARPGGHEPDRPEGGR